MGDQKDHETIQKKDTKSADSQVESQDFEMATESISPPSLQLKAEEGGEKEEGMEASKEGGSPYQFALDAPPENPDNKSLSSFEAEPIQGKGIAEPFKIPTIQKKELNPQTDRNTEKPSFTL